MPDAAEAAARGLEALQAGRYDEAVRAFAEAVRSAREIDALRFHYASALLWRGLAGLALPELDACIGLRGAWERPALDLAMQIRRQMALPVHGMMILPSAAAPLPRTTLPGTDAGPLLPGWAAAAGEIRRRRVTGQ